MGVLNGFDLIWVWSQIDEFICVLFVCVLCSIGLWGRFVVGMVFRCMRFLRRIFCDFGSQVD